MPRLYSLSVFNLLVLGVDCVAVCCDSCHCDVWFLAKIFYRICAVPFLLDLNEKFEKTSFMMFLNCGKMS